MTFPWVTCKSNSLLLHPRLLHRLHQGSDGLFVTFEAVSLFQLAGLRLRLLLIWLGVNYSLDLSSQAVAGLPAHRRPPIVKLAVAGVAGGGNLSAAGPPVLLQVVQTSRLNGHGEGGVVLVNLWRRQPSVLM